MKQKLFWQPETATFIINWSATLILLFYSLILALENTRPYWKSNLFLGFFFLVVAINLQRRIVIKKDTLIIYYARIWRKRKLTISEIQQVSIKKRHIRIETKQEISVFVLRRKDIKTLEDFFLSCCPQKVKNDTNEPVH